MLAVLHSLNKFSSCLNETTKRLIVGYSGGLDSSVLLHGLVHHPNISGRVNIIPVHINHGLHKNAEDWQNQCALMASQWDVTLVTKMITIDQKNKESLEAQARQLRYDCFNDIIQDNDILLTAHHQDDQAETLLLQLIRGAGPKGLSAMAYQKFLQKGSLVRPFLNLSRNDLQDYAKAHHVIWVEDDSNQDHRFSRNFLRHDIIPRLQERWPGLCKTLSRAAKHCASHEALLVKLMGKKLNELMLGQQLDLCQLAMCDQDEIHYLLRLWLERLSLPLPSSAKLDDIINHVIGAREDATPLVIWPGVEIRRYRQKLYGMKPLQPQDPKQVIQVNNIDMREQLGLPAEATMEIRFRRGGERCHIPGRQGHHSLKKIFQEKGIPPWERDRIPLLFVNGELTNIFWDQESRAMHLEPC